MQEQLDVGTAVQDVLLWEKAASLKDVGLEEGTLVVGDIELDKVPL